MVHFPDAALQVVHEQASGEFLLKPVGITKSDKNQSFMAGIESTRWNNWPGLNFMAGIE